MVRRLFLIHENKILTGIEHFHIDLAEICECKQDDIRGGGEWEYSQTLNAMVLFGTSGDFGSFNREEVQKIIDSKQVFQYCDKNISETMKILLPTIEE